MTKVLQNCNDEWALFLKFQQLMVSLASNAPVYVFEIIEIDGLYVL